MAAPLTSVDASALPGSAAGAPPSTKPRKLPGSLRVTGRDGSTAPFPWAGTSGAGATVSSDALRGTQQPAGVAAQPQPQPDGAVSDQPGVSGRQLRFQRVLNSPVVDLAALRELAWGGVPDQLRPAVWRLLTGYALPSAERRDAALERRRREYWDLVAQHYSVPEASRTEDEAATLRQIALDTPRTAPELAWVHCPRVQALLERLLFIRAVRSSAAGYVQGLGDVAVPFVAVFLSETACAGLDPHAWAARLDTAGGGGGSSGSKTPLSAAVDCAEADAYGCLCSLLDGIQDQYTFAQPGVQRKAHALGALLKRLDGPLCSHLAALGLDNPLVYAFRWINCLLQRELPFPLVPRLFDTYLAEGDAFPEFLTYVLVAFLTHWSPQLRACPDFQAAALLLQKPPTEEWSAGGGEVEQLLGRAHQHRVAFSHAGKHLV